MRHSVSRLGPTEYIAIVGLLLVAAGIAAAVVGNWTIGLVPGLTLGLGLVISYLLYQEARREKVSIRGLDMRLFERREQPYRGTAVAERKLEASVAAMFRVVRGHGVCTLGRREGDVLVVDAKGVVTPRVCFDAEVVLRSAAAVGDEDGDEWRCPVPEHFLVLRREPGRRS